jgi:GMP synthase (glutamine-hydrolysing)
MKVGILQTGRTPEEMRATHGDYDDLFRRLLDGRGFEFVTYPVLDNVLPASINEADGWLITGSKFGVYEGHDWIPPLESFLREAHAAARPIVGICFGHQVFAQAMGGTVEKFRGGWSVGAVDYQIDGAPHTLLAWHQDQITRLPEGARVVGSSDFCPYAMLEYGDNALTLQPHPEFTADFIADLLAARGEVLPQGIRDRVDRERFAAAETALFADRIAEVLQRGRD